MSLRGLETASYAAGFALASCEDPDYYGHPAIKAARADADTDTPMLPAAYVAANAGRRPYQEANGTQTLSTALAKSASREEWQRFMNGFSWGRGATA